MSQILSIESLGKRYGKTSILHDINLAMDKGEFLVLIGPSGSGKSTLLSCIAGLTEVTNGTINIENRDMTHVKPSERDIAMVFQSYALFPSMTVAGNITFGMNVRGVDKSTQKIQLDKVAKSLKIEQLLKRRPSELSGGQRQRVAMARALVREPHIFLFDEPLSNLDAKLRVSMRAEIKRIHKKLNASMIYVTHDQIEAMTLATKIVLLNNGQIQQIGTPAELYNSPANVFVATFMGSPSMNIIPATVSGDGSSVTVKFIDGEGNTASLIDNNPAPALLHADNQEVLFGIRPEAISDATLSSAPTQNTVSLPVEMVDPAGADTYVSISLQDQKIVSRLPGTSPVEEGHSFVFDFDLSSCSYFNPATHLRFA